METEPEMRAAHAAVLRETDPAVGRELGCLDLADCGCHKAPKFLALLFRDRGLQVLDLRLVFSYEDNESHIGNSGHPRIADQLRVEGKQPGGLLRITAGRSLPVHKAPDSIELTDGVDVGNKLIGVREVPDDLDLKVLFRLGNANPIVLSKALEKMTP